MRDGPGRAKRDGGTRHKRPGGLSRNLPAPGWARTGQDRELPGRRRIG